MSKVSVAKFSRNIHFPAVVCKHIHSKLNPKASRTHPARKTDHRHVDRTSSCSNPTMLPGPPTSIHTTPKTLKFQISRQRISISFPTLNTHPLDHKSAPDRTDILSATMAPSPRAPAATPTQTELANGHEAFHVSHHNEPITPSKTNPFQTQTTRRLYVDLAERFRHRPYFLPRTLSTRHKRSRYPPRARVVCVQYVSTEPGVEWARTVPALRCYWCRELFPVFKDCKDLLTHLRTCHSMLGYAVDESRAKNSVTVSVSYHFCPLPHLRIADIFPRFVCYAERKAHMPHL